MLGFRMQLILPQTYIKTSTPHNSMRTTPYKFVRAPLFLRIFGYSPLVVRRTHAVVSLEYR